MAGLVPAIHDLFLRNYYLMFQMQLIFDAVRGECPRRRRDACLVKLNTRHARCTLATALTESAASTKYHQCGGATTLPGKAPP